MTTPATERESERFSISRISPRGRDALCIVFLGVLVLLALPGLYRYQGPPMEEGFMLAFPEQILKGNMPHRDFLHLYGPGSLWLLAIVYKVAGVTLAVERSVGLLQHLGTTFGLFFLLKPFGRRVATVAGAVSFIILIGPAGLSALAWNGALALGICSLAVGAAAAHAEPGRRAVMLAVISGTLAGTALLFRPDMIIAMGLAGVAMLLRQPRDRRVAMLGGGVVTLLLYIPHMVISGVGDSFNGMFMDPVFRLRPGRTLPAPPSWGSIDGFLQRVGTLRTTGWPLPMLDQSYQIYIWFWLVPISILLVLVAAWRLRRRQPQSRLTTALWPASLFNLALITQAFQRPDSTHLAWVTGISFPLLIPAVLVLLDELAERVGQRRTDASPNPSGRILGPLRNRQIVAIALPLVILVGVVPFYPLRTYADLVSQSFGFNRFGFPVERDGRVFYLGDPTTARDAQRITDELGDMLKEGQTLIVGPRDMSRTNYSDSFFYYLFPDLESGTRYIEMDPGLADTDESGLSEELAKADWLVLSDVWAGWTEPNESAVSRSQKPNRVIDKHFCTVAEAGLFTLMKRCR
ncbi:MAG: hypothetical protein V9F03_02615 [Microthrixaceae bacterium]